MRRARRSSDEGAAAVEFAIVSVLLLTILFGILQYGFFFLQSTGMEAATREGARHAAVNGAATAADVVTAAAPTGIAPTTTVCWDDLAPSGEYNRGDNLEVIVTWTPTNFGLPFVPFLSGDYEDRATTRVERTEGIAAPGPCVAVAP